MLIYFSDVQNCAQVYFYDELLYKFFLMSITKIKQLDFL